MANELRVFEVTDEGTASPWSFKCAKSAQYVFEQLDNADRLIVMRILSDADQRERAETNATGA